MSFEEIQNLYLKTIKESIHENGVTAVYLSQKLHIDERRLGRILRNDYMMYAYELIVLCGYLGISLDDLCQAAAAEASQRNDDTSQGKQ